MNKNLREIIVYAVTFIVIFLLPNLFFYYVKREDSEIFHQRIREDNQICLQRAKENSRDAEWCDEIRKAATLNYNETRSSNNGFLLLMMFQPLLFVLLISQYNLRKQVQELKEKTDV